MTELGPLFEVPHSPGSTWLAATIVLVALVVIGIASIALIRGRLPVALSSAALLLLPAFSFVVADLHLLEESKTVDFCASCHTTMSPLAESMRSGDDESLASIHYAKGAVSHADACYQCHSGYGLWGTVNAKMAGVGHMVRTVTSWYHYPLESKSFDIASCQGCHSGAAPFREVPVHRTDFIQKRLLSGDLSCAGVCHPPAHPTRALNGAEAWESTEVVIQ